MERTVGLVVSGSFSEVGMVLDYMNIVVLVLIHKVEHLRIDDSIYFFGSRVKEIRKNVRFDRKNSPEMFKASHLTTTIFCPLSSCLATVLARRPSRCPLPSIMTYFDRKPTYKLFVFLLQFELSRYLHRGKLLPGKLTTGSKVLILVYLLMRLG